MASEIERKFLVRGDGWRAGPDGVLQRQGYIAIEDHGVVRTRIEGDRATLTIKSAQRGLTRDEFEYEIPVADAKTMLENLCVVVIEKTRHKREFGGRTWEVDVFHGVNDGLVVAEVELPSEDAEVELPDWVGDDISMDVRYRVSELSREPFTKWRNGST
jgi:adenylate cyclase